MKIQHVLAILLRLCAIVIFIYGIRLTLWIVGRLPAEDPWLTSDLIYVGASTLALFALGLCCWFLPMLLAKWIVRPAWDQPVGAFHATALLKVLVIFLGLYYFLNSLINFAHYAFQWWFTEQLITEGMTQNFERWYVAYATDGFQLILGLFLLTKNHWICQVLLNLNRPETPDQAD